MIQRLAKIKSIMKSGDFIFDSRSELKLNPLIVESIKNKQGKNKKVMVSLSSAEVSSSVRVASKRLVLSF